MVVAKVKNALKGFFGVIAITIHMLLMIAIYLFVAGAAIVVPALFFIWVCRKLFGWF